MPTSVSNITLSNRSLLAVGGRTQISSFNEGTPASNACSLLFVPTFEQLGRSAYWSCLRAQTTLTLLKAAKGTPENPNGTTLPLPPSPWLYSYLYPPTCLHARAIVPTLPVTGVGTVPLTSVNNTSPTFIPSDGQIPFQIGYDTDATNNPVSVILTNQSQAQLIFTVDQPNPTVWDTQLQAAFVASLAVFLTPALTLNFELMKVQLGVAERIIMEARAADANEGSSTQDRTADWILARRGSGSSIYGNNVYGNSNYLAMSWPSY